MSTASVQNTPGGDAGIEVAAIPFVRRPLLDRDAQLAAYDICHQAGEGGGSLARATLSLLGEPYLGLLAGGQVAFLEIDGELFKSHADALKFDAHLGPRVDARLAASDPIYDELGALTARGVPVMVDNLVWPESSDPETQHRLTELVRSAHCVSIDVRGHDEATLVRALGRLRFARPDVAAVATYLYERRTHRACLNLGFDLFEGTYLLRPDEDEFTDTLKPNSVNLLRLLGAVQNPNNGPTEIEAIIRNDAVLSFKLLKCVNSAYFGLPRELKSLQQAAVYFGVTRLRNWVYALALGELDEAPPELLKQALVRARMAELLGRALPTDLRELAFMTGLFSLLDTITGAPIEQVLAEVSVAEEVRGALVEGTGPLGRILARIRDWEGGVAQARLVDASVARAYAAALEWGEQVYGAASRRAA